MGAGPVCDGLNGPEGRDGADWDADWGADWGAGWGAGWGAEGACWGAHCGDEFAGGGAAAAGAMPQTSQNPSASTSPVQPGWVHRFIAGSPSRSRTP